MLDVGERWFLLTACLLPEEYLELDTREGLLCGGGKARRRRAAEGRRGVSLVGCGGDFDCGVL